MGLQLHGLNVQNKKFFSAETAFTQKIHHIKTAYSNYVLKKL